MAKFPIGRAKRTLPEIAPAARAQIDVRTGAREFAQAVSELGRDIEKFELMQAETQLSEFKRKVREEHNRLAMSYDGNLDPTTFKSDYQESLTVRQGLIPKNRFASRAAQQWLNERMPVWAAGIEKARQARVEDNFRAEGFELKIEAEKTGDVSKYLQHLDTGKSFGIYGAEESVKLEQSTIDEAERGLINSLIRSGQTDLAFKAIEASQLKEGEKRSFENIASAAEKARQTQAKLAIEQKDDEISEGFLDLLINKLEPDKPQLDFKMIVDSELSFDAKDKWFTKLRTFDNYSEAELKEAFIDKGEVLADIYDRIDNNAITDDQIREQVGIGLSAPTAQRIIKERRAPFEKDTEQLFKRIFGWTPELGFGEKRFAPFAYEKTLREWQAEVKEQEATGEDIIKIGRSIARPYLLEHLEKEMPSDTDITRMMELALGEETEKLETPKPIEAEEPRREPGEPLTLDDFTTEVSRLKGIDRTKAREYYDLWIGKFKAE